MTIHYLAGLPRSGSTLLANILAQHPQISVTGTSPLFGAVNAVADALSNVPEVAAELQNVPGTYDRYVASLRAFMDAWHRDAESRVVIDKHRAWPHRFALLKQIDPDSKLIATVRDPRSVVASFERQERKTGLFNSPVAPTLYSYADNVMSPEGMVGRPLRMLEDMLHRQVPVFWVRYESFVQTPEVALERLLESLDLEPFQFDLDNIENHATDLDVIYKNKFPHHGAGTLTADRAQGWGDVMTEDIAGLIAGVSPLIMQTFGYTV